MFLKTYISLHISVRIRGLEMQVFWEILRTYKINEHIKERP